MNHHHILVIEDDPDILELIQFNLEKHSFKVSTAASGELGLQFAKEFQPDLILLDVMLPTMDGHTVCRNLKEIPETKNIPIIMLTAKNEESDIVVGLELGADDYMGKPFSPRELYARIKALLRRSRPTQENRNFLHCGPISLDTEKHEIFFEGNQIHLTLTEFNILKTLISKPGRVFSREQLIRNVMGDQTYVIDRNVDVHIRALRKKLGEKSEFIKTIRGVGYKCVEA